MKDFELFDQSLSKVDSYLSSLSRSMSLVLEEYYKSNKIYHSYNKLDIDACGVSAHTSKGFD
jgi:hypothetical protein